MCPPRPFEGVRGCKGVTPPEPLPHADHLANEQTLLAALDPSERETLAVLLRRLLLSPPFRDLDPAPGSDL